MTFRRGATAVTAGALVGALFAGYMAKRPMDVQTPILDDKTYTVVNTNCDEKTGNDKEFVFAWEGCDSKTLWEVVRDEPAYGLKDKPNKAVADKVNEIAKKNGLTEKDDVVRMKSGKKCDTKKGSDSVIDPRHGQKIVLYGTGAQEGCKPKYETKTVKEATGKYTKSVPGSAGFLDYLLGALGGALVGGLGYLLGRGGRRGRRDGDDDNGDRRPEPPPPPPAVPAEPVAEAPVEIVPAAEPVPAEPVRPAEPEQPAAEVPAAEVAPAETRVEVPAQEYIDAGRRAVLHGRPLVVREATVGGEVIVPPAEAEAAREEALGAAAEVAPAQPAEEGPRGPDDEPPAGGGRRGRRGRRNGGEGGRGPAAPAGEGPQGAQAYFSDNIVDTLLEGYAAYRSGRREKADIDNKAGVYKAFKDRGATKKAGNKNIFDKEIAEYLDLDTEIVNAYKTMSAEKVAETYKAKGVDISASTVRRLAKSVLKEDGYKALMEEKKHKLIPFKGYSSVNDKVVKIAPYLSGTRAA